MAFANFVFESFEALCFAQLSLIWLPIVAPLKGSVAKAGDRLTIKAQNIARFGAEPERATLWILARLAKVNCEKFVMYCPRKLCTCLPELSVFICTKMQKLSVAS